jgi:hypothetical protein
VPEKSFVVAPERRLATRERNKHKKRNKGPYPQRHSCRGLLEQPAPDSPATRDEDADEREISVAVRQRLLADLDQPDNRQNRDQLPEPAGEKPGMAPPQ